MLDLQMQQKRALRQRSTGRRTAFRVGGILLILGGCLAAFFVLQYAMSEMRPPEGLDGTVSGFEQVD